MKNLKKNLLLTTAGLLLAVNAHATNRTWTGGGTDNNWLTANNWGGTAPAVNGDSPIFSGSTRQNNTNNYPAITNAAVTFSSGGWTLNGNPLWLGGTLTSSTGTNVINLNVGLTATRTVSVSSGELFMNGVISGAFGLTTSGAGSGTLVLAASNTCSGTVTITAGDANVLLTNPHGLGTGSVSIPKTGTTASGILKLQMTGNNTVTNTFGGFSSTTGGGAAVPDIENISGTNTLTSALQVTGSGGNGLIVQSDGGLLTLAGPISTTITSRYVQLGGAGNGVVSGSITNPSADSFPVVKWGSGDWTLAGTNTYTGATTINAGTLALGATGSISNTPSVSLAPGSIFDVSALAAGWSLSPGQTLQGSGTILGNVQATNGTTTLQPGAISSPGTTQGTLLFNNNLALNNANLNFNLSSDPTGLTYPSDQIVVSGNLTASGVNTFQLGSYLEGYIPDGTYTLITCAGTLTGSAANFTVTDFTVGGRGVQGGYIITTPNSVQLVVTGTPPANLVWAGDGTDNYWDVTTTSNWLNNGSQDEFFNYDSVTFDDTATNFTVNVDQTVTPGSLTVNATNAYTISGSGSIAGVTGLTKTGPGTLTLAGNNTFTGTTTYGGGSIAVATIGNNATASPLGEGSQFLNGGTLEYTGAGESNNRGYTIGTNGGTVSVDTLGATLTFNTSGVWNSGGNTFIKTGPGILAFSFQQILTGTNLIEGGILKIPTVALYGTDMTTPVFINGGELDLAGNSFSTKPVVASGMGDPAINASTGTTNGAIINSGASQTQGLQYVTLTGDTAFGGTGRWDIRANPTATLSTGGNPYNLVKAGANQISLVNVAVDPALANINVQAGVLSYETGTTGLGNPADTISVQGGADLDFYAATVPLNKQIVLYDSSGMSASNGVSTVVGPIYMPGNNSAGPTFTVAPGVTLDLNGVVSGPGTLTLAGNGTLNLSATNTYTGTTTVSGGTLMVSSAQNGNGDIVANDGTAFGVTVAGASELMPNNFTLGNSGGLVTNNFSGLSSTTVAPIAATNLNVNDTVTINITSGNLLSGQIYPLISFVNLGGSGGFVLGTLPPLTTGALVTNGNTIALSVISSSTIESWVGNVNNNWDIVTTPNWIINGSAATYADGNNVLFNDAASNASVNITATVQPKSVTVNNNVLGYSFSGSSISSTGSVTKLGSGSLIINNANSYSGGTTLSAGTLDIDNNGALGTGLFTVNGGTIDNNGAGLVTLTNNNAQLWNADINFIGDQSLNLGAGPVTLAANRQVAVAANTLAISGPIGDNGSGYALTLAGGGTLNLFGSNTYSGVTTLVNGALNIFGNQPGATGGFLVCPGATNACTLNFRSGSVVTVASPGQIQVGNNTGSGTSTQTLNVASASVTNNGLLYCGRPGVVNITTNSVWVQNVDMAVDGQGGYAAHMNVTSGATFIYDGPDTVEIEPAYGNFADGMLNISGATFVTSQGFERLVSTSTGNGILLVQNGGVIQLSADIPQLIAVNTGTAVFTNGPGGAIIDTAGFSTEISVNESGPGSLTKRGSGTLTINSPVSYTGDTIVSNGTLALIGSASLASTNINIADGATLDMSGLSSSPYVLAAGRNLTNSSAALAGTLAGSVDASVGGIGLAYAAGTPSLNVTNGTLTLASTTTVSVNNTGAALTNGAYELIAAGNGGAVGGTAPAAVTVGGGGLGNSGSASLSLAGGNLYLNVTGVIAVNPNPTNIVSSVSGATLNLAWPADHTGWRLLVQTNNLNLGISSNPNDWGTVPGSAATNMVALPLNPALPSEFYQLVYP